MSSPARRFLLVVVLVSFSSFGLLHDFDLAERHAPVETEAGESELVPHLDLICTFLIVVGGILLRSTKHSPDRPTLMEPFPPLVFAGMAERMRGRLTPPLFSGVCPLLA